MALHTVDVVIVAVYLLGMLAVGWAVARRIRGFSDFFVAGRALTTPMLICTIVSTYYGLDVLFGDSGDAAKEGVVIWFVYTNPYVLTLLVAAFFVASRFEKTDFMSIPDVLAAHYGSTARVAGAAASFFYSLPIMAIMGMAAFGQVLFGWPLWVGAVAGSVLAAIYTVLGGFWADVLTDTVQFVIMCVALAVALPFAVHAAGGFDQVEATLGPKFFAPLGTAPPLYTAAFGLTALSVLVEPSFYQRIFAARDRRAVRNAFLWGILVWTAVNWAVSAVGIAGASLMADGTLPADTPPDQVLLRVVLHYLPVGLSGLFLGGCLAAAMSTIDSYLLIAAGNVVYDVYRPLVRPDMDDRTLVGYTRTAIVGSALLCILLGLYFQRIKEAWAFMATILTATVLVPMSWALIRHKSGQAPRPMPLAGALSTTAGLLTVLSYYTVLGVAGTRNEALATREITVWGLNLLNEYALFFALPASGLGFVVGAILERRR